ncbi:hypothetical protein M199_gp113 [Halogranum tailed virus 1]|uniref:Uncharacterized protein n=1 Tax=Halogranum tailed virus 1 TaxID=1273749 RepID=R4TMX9_9CAUD|nr:hypothetical protein M199_gp113 [Halogranum tailed virus 1]AGM11553.1 hypothetical protein HGTV1_256 [Halogranum tailed virus 1]
MRKVFAICLVAGMLLLAGCTGGGSTPEPSDSSDVTDSGSIVYDGVQTSNDVVRFVDHEAGVVCYYFAHPDGYAGQGGISCVPLNQTNLE